MPKPKKSKHHHPYHSSQTPYGSQPSQNPIPFHANPFSAAMMPFGSSGAANNTGTGYGGDSSNDQRLRQQGRNAVKRNQAAEIKSQQQMLQQYVQQHSRPTAHGSAASNDTTTQALDVLKQVLRNPLHLNENPRLYGVALQVLDLALQ